MPRKRKPDPEEWDKLLGHYAPPHRAEWFFMVEPGNDVAKETVEELIRYLAPAVAKTIGYGIKVGQHRNRAGEVGWHVIVQITGPIGPGGLPAPLLTTSGVGPTLDAAMRALPLGLHKMEKEAKMNALFGTEYQLNLSRIDQFMEDLQN
jgi:hypothetical protein